MIYTRNIQETDATLLRSLAKQNSPLDVHTPYTYWVVSKYFGDTSFLLFDDDKPIGYITAVYNGTSLLIWQICVIKEYRGRDCSQTLINAVYEQAMELGQNITVTIADGNMASRAAFKKFCRTHDMDMSRIGAVSLTDPDDEGFSEVESMYCLSPVDKD